MECFSKKKKVGVVPQILSLSHFLHCVAMLVGHCCVKKKKKKNPHIPLSSVLPPKSCKKLQICVTSVTRGVYTTVLKEARNGPDAE